METKCKECSFNLNNLKNHTDCVKESYSNIFKKTNMTNVISQSNKEELKFKRITIMKTTLIITAIFFLTICVYVNLHNIPWLIFDIVIGISLLLISNEY